MTQRFWVLILFMLQKLQYWYFYYQGKKLMSNYIRAVDALTNGLNVSYKEKINQAEMMCPCVKTYRIKGLFFARKAKSLKK